MGGERREVRGGRWEEGGGGGTGVRREMKTERRGEERRGEERRDEMRLRGNCRMQDYKPE